jgi:AP-4 complex subunit epsilon-1
MIAFVLECFRVISQIPTTILKPQLAMNGSKALSLLGRLINSHKPNTQYFALTCLLELDAALWAGTADDFPPVFDEGQVHTVMGFLESSDSTIRVKVRGHLLELIRS